MHTKTQIGWLMGASLVLTMASCGGSDDSDSGPSATGSPSGAAGSSGSTGDTGGTTGTTSSGGEGNEPAGGEGNTAAGGAGNETGTGGGGVTGSGGTAGSPGDGGEGAITAGAGGEPGGPGGAGGAPGGAGGAPAGAGGVAGGAGGAGGQQQPFTPNAPYPWSYALAMLSTDISGQSMSEFDLLFGSSGALASADGRVCLPQSQTPAAGDWSTYPYDGYDCEGCLFFILDTGYGSPEFTLLGAEPATYGAVTDCPEYGGMYDLCTPDCDGRNCGSDGCNGSCGTCPSGLVCVGGVCGDPCADCLDACSGMASCCCGAGCICESVCTPTCQPL